MNTVKKAIEITFVEPLIGTTSGDKELVRTHLSKDIPPEKLEEELAALPEELEKASTVFPKDEHGLFVWDYQVRGFFKETLARLIELGAAPSTLNPWNYKKAVNNFLFVFPRRIPLMYNGGQVRAPHSVLDRPVVCETQRGQRIALNRGEICNPGTHFWCEVMWLTGTNTKSRIAVFTDELVESILNMGSLVGMGAWRGSGSYGRLQWKASA